MPNLIANLIFASLLSQSSLNFFNLDLPKFNQTEIGPKRIINQSLGIKTTAKSILLIDDESGAILYEKNKNQILPIASITKLMTALVLLETKPNWDKSVEILKSDHRPGNITYLLTGEKVNLKDLFNLMLVASANEAAIALARVSGLNDFSSLMNQKAAALGMKDTYFLEPSGIEAGNVSSATDLAKLINAAFAYPAISEAVTKLEYTFSTLNTQRTVRFFNTNNLLATYLNRNQLKIILAKTGHLDEAGYCLILKIKIANGKILTLIMLGSQTSTDRNQEAKGLVAWVMENYEF
ncbi:MAG TPA: serine hydrolase [Patescibacteria group bacterium]|nr:serine hydrolase [Patescibacteria group bacterium]